MKGPRVVLYPRGRDEPVPAFESNKDGTATAVAIGNLLT